MFPNILISRQPFVVSPPDRLQAFARPARATALRAASLAPVASPAAPIRARAPRRWTSPSAVLGQGMRTKGFHRNLIRNI